MAKESSSAARGTTGKGRNTSFSLYREGQSTPAITLTVGLVLAGRRWRALLDEALRNANQSSARMETLAAIINSPALSPQVDIARRLRIEGPTLTRMLDGLEKDGLVERLADPSDRRTKQLRVTAEGEAVLEEMFAIADDLRSRLLEDLSDKQIEQANGILALLINRLDEGLQPGG